MLDKKALAIIIILLAWSIGATATTVIFYNQFQRYYQKYQEIISGKTITVSILINYGNGTLVWYNNTIVFKGSTVYDALVKIANVNASTTPFGVYVHGINGVNEDKEHAWMYAIRRNDSSVNAFYEINGWYYPGVGASSLILKDGDVVAWVFLNWVKYLNNLPDPTTDENLR